MGILAPSALAPECGLGWVTISLLTHLLVLCENTLEVSVSWGAAQW